MFNKDFFPTPQELVRKLYQKVSRSLSYDLRVLEPSAGKADIVEGIEKLWKTDHGQHYENSGNSLMWDVIEKNEELEMILHGKGLNVVGRDFLEYSTATEYSTIIANPPFSNGASHLLKMISLAEKQLVESCTIVCLLNAETLKNTFSTERKFLAEKLKFYNAEVEIIQDGFTNAERKTVVETALISFTVKPKSSYFDFDKLFTTQKLTQSDKFELSLPDNQVGYAKEEIETLVNMYKEHATRFKNFFGAFRELEIYEAYADTKSYVSLRESYTETLENIRISYWCLILKSDKFRELLTSEAYQALNKKITSLSGLEPTLENVQNMLMAISQNSQDIATSAIVSLFDDLTKYSMNEYSKNIHYYNGWKSNSAFKINKKVVVPHHFRMWRGYSDVDCFEEVDSDIRYYMNDLMKGIKLVSNKDAGEWIQVGGYEFENNLIKFKHFKKGTTHVWFKDLAILEKLNYVAAKDKGWLPTDEEVKHNKKAKEFIKKEFPKLYEKDFLLKEK